MTIQQFNIARLKAVKRGKFDSVKVSPQDWFEMLQRLSWISGIYSTLYGYRVEIDETVRSGFVFFCSNDSQVPTIIPLT